MGVPCIKLLKKENHTILRWKTLRERALRRVRRRVECQVCGPHSSFLGYGSTPSV